MNQGHTKKNKGSQNSNFLKTSKCAHSHALVQFKSW